VITKGATRISEVAARFALDGMPGKQMAIDADLNAGMIDEREAQQRREEITQQADFYGAMDGATKFVRGDAIAAIIIVLINIIAGLIIGVTRLGLEPGEAVIVKVTLEATDSAASPGTSMPDVSLEVPDGLRIETPRLWIPSLGEADWRIVADEPGSYEITIQVGADTYSKSVVVSSDVVKRSPIRANALLDQILYPGEPAFPSGAAVSSIEVMYPERALNFFGWQAHWLIPYMIITIVLAFALKKPMGVTF